MSLVKQYISLTKEAIEEYGEQTVVLLQCGSFYEVYACGSEGDYQGSHIEDVSRVCDLHIAKKQAQVDGKQVFMAGFGLGSLDKYTSKLQDAGYTVVVYDQDPEVPGTKKSLKDGSSTVLARHQREIISPGTYVGNERTDSLSNNLVCINLCKTGKHSRKCMVGVGVARLDNLTGESSLMQFVVPYRRDSSTYDDLERHVSVFNPSECIVVGGGYDCKELLDVVNFVGLSNAKVHIIGDDSDNGLVKRDYVQNAFKQKYQVETFRRQFPAVSEEVVTDALRSHDVGLAAYVLLIGFAHMHNPSLVNRIAFPKFENNTDKLLLRTHSLRQLNIIDDKRYDGQLRSVTAFLNKCVTNMGRREFYSSLVAPSTDVDYLESCYDTTDRLIETDAWSGLKQDLRPVIDVDRLCRKISRNQVSPKDIAELVFSLRSSLKVWDKVQELELAGAKQFDESVREDIVQLLGQIEKDIDVDKAVKIQSLSIEALGNMDPTESLFLIPGAEETIDAACAECDKSMTQLETIRSTLSGLIALNEKKTVKTEFIKIHDTPKMPPCLVATSRRATLLRSAVDDKGGVAFAGGAGELIADDLTCVPHSATKNVTVISSPRITAICQSIHRSRERMINDIIVFFKRFVETLSLDLGRIGRISRFLAWADVAQCRAYVATKYGFTRPECVKYSMWSFLEAKGLRHPLVEHLQTRETYVANDVDLCAGGMLLYGTNAVGKTCLIRSIGIAVIMAQSGLHVSASGFRFAPYKNIFTRIVGNDDIFKGLSTFAVEMSELRTILESADNSSLVLGDELCSGTESGSARSIFMAGIEWLSKTYASFLFATHFHEINDYPELAALDNVTLNHMEVRYDSESKELIYDRKLRDGPGFSSYGLEVCKALSLPDQFLARAHEIRRLHDPATKDVLETQGSRYNASKLKGACEMCGADGVEVHHLAHQKNADKKGRTARGHHKNHPANLMNICEACHDGLHQKGSELRRTKTTGGYRLEAI